MPQIVQALTDKAKEGKRTAYEDAGGVERTDAERGGSEGGEAAGQEPGRAVA